MFVQWPPIHLCSVYLDLLQHEHRIAHNYYLLERD